MPLYQKAEKHKKLRFLLFKHPKDLQKTSKNVKKGSKKGHFRVFLTLFDIFCTFIPPTLFRLPFFENHEKNAWKKRQKTEKNAKTRFREKHVLRPVFDVFSGKMQENEKKWIFQKQGPKKEVKKSDFSRKCQKTSFFRVPRISKKRFIFAPVFTTTA